MAISTTTILTVGSLALYLIKYLLQRTSEKRIQLPPGPKGVPLLGNIGDLPKPGKAEWLHWLLHKERYGPISSVTVMGQTLIIINDAQMALDLLERQSSTYSSRPKQVFAGEMVGWENSIALTPYSRDWRTHRKNVARILGSKVAASQFHPLQEAEVGHFLLHVLEKPECLSEHIRKEAGMVTLKVVYGYTAKSHEPDPLVDLAEGVLTEFSQAAVPGAFLVDVMPFLKRFPDWFPGTGFKQIGQKWRDNLQSMADIPFEFVKYQMAQGRYEASFVSRLLERGGIHAEEDAVLHKWTALSLYSAGADTTVSAMASFFLAMCIFPEVQRKAQREIDQVVGTERLPNFQDRESLPYIDALVKEVLRWHPVTPMSLPHTSTEDSIFEGYFIPKGAMLLPNVWFFMHNPDIYEKPMEFNPDRFLSTGGRIPVPDPHKFAFGFGRRICPGRIMASSSLYLNIAQSLAVFNISKAIVNGKEVEPAVKFEPGVISHPAPYQASIKPRSPHHEALIRSIEKTNPWQESDAQVLEKIIH